MTTLNMSASTQKYTVRPLVINFEAKQKEADSGIFSNPKIHNYALQTLRAMGPLCAQIKAEVEHYNAGNTSYRDPIVQKTEQIKRDLINPQRFPKVFDRGQLKSLEAFFAPIKDGCEQLHAALFKEEIETKEDKDKLVAEKGQRLSLLLANEQQDFAVSRDIFGVFLERLATDVAQSNKTPTVYFAYAWPVEERALQEKWVQPFLKLLQSHLKMAGVHSAYLDITTNRYGANIYEYMQKTQSSDYVLIFGTPSLKKKHDTGLSAVCTELVHVLRKRQDDLKGDESLRRVFPILLSGSHRESFPPEFERYITVRDWRLGGYLTHLQYLYLELFRLPPEDYLEAVQQFWEEALQGGAKEHAQKMEETMTWYTERREEVQSCKSAEQVLAVPVSQPMPVLSASMSQLSIQAVPLAASRAAGAPAESKEAFTISAQVAQKIDAWAPFVCQVCRNQDSHVGGTGFLIAPGVLMTCSHVLPDPDTARKSHLVFEIHSQKYQVYLDADTFFINSPSPGNRKIPQASTMDYTVVPLQTQGLPPEVLAMSQEARSIFQGGVTGPAMRDLEGVSMIHYPTQRGKAKEKMIGYGSLEVTWRDAFNLCHLVPTKVGSSGAPLFNEEGQLLGMHRGEQGSIMEGGVQYGTAVPIEQIMVDLKTHLHQEKIEQLTRKESEGITNQVLKVGGLTQQDPYAPAAREEAQRLQEMLQAFTLKNIDPDPTLMQKLLQPLKELDRLLKAVTKFPELKMLLSQSYQLLLELLWYQYWYQLQQPMDKEMQEQALAQAAHQLGQLPDEVRFQDGQLISTVDTKFYLLSMQQAAQCLGVGEGAWKVYISECISKPSFQQVYTNMKASAPSMPLADWYVETWRMGWVSLEITTVKDFERALVPGIPMYLQRGKEYTMGLVIAYMHILNNPHATQDLKDTVFHGEKDCPGLRSLVSIEYEAGWLDLLKSPEALWNKIIGEVDRFEDTRYLAMKYLFRFAREGGQHPYQKESEAVLLERFKNLQHHPHTHFQEEKTAYGRRLGEIDQECVAVAKEREPLEEKWYYFSQKTRSSAEEGEMETLQAQIENLEGVEKEKQGEKEKVQRALAHMEGLILKQEQEKQVVEEMGQFLMGEAK